MKCVKVQIRRGGVGEDMMVYPARYNAQEVDRNGLGPLSVNGDGAYEGGIGRGADHEFCYIMLDDALADEYDKDPLMSIVDPTTADSDMETWRSSNHRSEIVINDPEMVRFVQEKKAAADRKVAEGKELTSAETVTAEDLKVLDPDDRTPGVVRRLRKVADIATDAGKSLVGRSVGEIQGGK